MQGLAGNLHQLVVEGSGLEILKALKQGIVAAIEFVSEERKSMGFGVNADLVLAAGAGKGQTQKIANALRILSLVFGLP